MIASNLPRILLRRFPKDGLWVPFSNFIIKEIPEVARKHIILAMLGVTSHTPRTRTMLSAHNMVSAWNALTPI